MDNKNKGLYKKYNVTRVDGKPVGRAIVLEFGDPNAWPALRQWAKTVRSCGYAKLADDVESHLIDAQDQYSGPGEEDGPWAEGWEERSSNHNKD